jgi:hypothetical protein
MSNDIRSYSLASCSRTLTYILGVVSVLDVARLAVLIYLELIN